MTAKTVLVTGANKSIGFETARQMGRQGYRIWPGSRDEKCGQDGCSWRTSEEEPQVEIHRHQRGR